MPKTLFLIPGFTHSVKQKEYKKVTAMFKKHGYTVIGFEPSWKRSTVSDQVATFVSFVDSKKINPDDCAILGFSFGAIVALISAGKIKPKELFLCSLSPYFSEDIKIMPAGWKKFIGKKRVADFEKMNCRKLCKQINSSAHIFVGEKESNKFPILLRRVQAAHKYIPASTWSMVPNTGHDIGQKEYLAAIGKQLDL